MNRENITKSMPRKSKHGSKIARWTTHKELKKYRDKYKKEG